MEARKALAQQQKELFKAQARMTELDTLFRKLYEDLSLIHIFHALEAAETQAFSALNIPLATPCFAPYRSAPAPCFGTGKEYYRRSF